MTGLALVVGVASARAQSRTITATLEYHGPVAGQPRPNFSPKGTQIGLTPVAASVTLPAGSIRPAKTGTIKVGPDEKGWIPILVTADSAHPVALTLPVHRPESQRRLQ